MAPHNGTIEGGYCRDKTHKYFLQKVLQKYYKSITHKYYKYYTSITKVLQKCYKYYKSVTSITSITLVRADLVLSRIFSRRGIMKI